MSNINDPTKTPRRIHLYSPAVDFIDTRLPQLHPVFEHTEAIYDENINQYVIDSQVRVSSSNSGPMAPPIGLRQALTAPTHVSRTQGSESPISAPSMPRCSQPTSRQLPPKVEDMKFWGPMWPKAMSRLRKTAEASGRKDKGFSIREAKTWEDITNVINRAHEEYVGLVQGHSNIGGRAKHLFRSSGERVATPLQQITKVLPNHPIATPVLGAVNLLMNVRCLRLKYPPSSLLPFSRFPRAG